MQGGKGAWLAKSDIKSAFRLLPVHPSDYELLGFSFEGQFYYDKCLPMGCSISCSLFELFSTFLEFRVKHVTRSQGVTHYLDDFLFVGNSAASCASLLSAFSRICQVLGVPIAQEKTLGPVQAITYLGLEIDTVAQQIRVPSTKVRALCDKIYTVLCKRKISLVEVQSLVGSLNFVCRAISPGRAFLRRLIALSQGLLKPHHRVRISTGARLDLLMWLEFFCILMVSPPFCSGIGTMQCPCLRMQRHRWVTALIVEANGCRVVGQLVFWRTPLLSRFLNCSP